MRFRAPRSDAVRSVQDLRVPDASVHTRSPLPENRHTSLSLFPGVEASKPPCLQKWGVSTFAFAIAQGVKNCVPPCQYHKARRGSASPMLLSLATKCLLHQKGARQETGGSQSYKRTKSKYVFYSMLHFLRRERGE